MSKPASPGTRCIFCKAPTRDEPEEHIVADSLLGDVTFDAVSAAGIVAPPRRLVLCSDEVCRKCNAAVGKLDQYLQEQLGFLKVLWNGLRTKKGKPASMRRPGAYAVRTANGPHIVLNGETHPVTLEDGMIVPPAGTSEDAVRVISSEIDGRSMHVTFTQPTRTNKRFIRALHKVAFELLCFQQGAEYVLDGRFDWIRAYVLHGIGSRVICIPRRSTERMPAVRLFVQQIPGRMDWIVQLTFGVPYILDLSAENVVSLGADPMQLGAADLVLWSDKEGGRPFARASG